MQRSAGILLPISSLPSPYGIGCFSQEAYDFVDWLKEAGQTYWQILPLGVTSYGDSPYQSFSALFLNGRNNLLTDTIIFNCFVILCTAHMMTCSIVASYITAILCHSGA